MKTVFDKATRDDLIGRIKILNENNTPQWGKMNVYQMLKHCVLADEMYLGKRTYKRVFIGRLLGKMILKKMLKDETPMRQNEPTLEVFKITETNGDILAEKNKWISVIEDYATFSDPYFTHWFFGKMSKEQVGQFAYKHIDHHLRQFNS